MYRGVASIYARTPVRKLTSEKIFSLNLLAGYFIFLTLYWCFFIISLYPSINHSVLATNGQMYLSGKKKNALCTPPLRSASLTSFPSTAGILEGQFTMP